MRIHLVAGARPNFMKIAPLWHGLRSQSDFDVKIVHTGQHYSPEMSEFIFKDLKLPQPDFQLSVGSGTHTTQTAKVMLAYENCLKEDRPDLVIVPGDVNSTLSCALAAKQLGIKVAHLEAGLRSFDRSMPEELNRVIVDQISDIHWTPSEDADENLLKEGVNPERIFRVGNIMIDAIELLRGEFEKIPLKVGEKDLVSTPYIIATFHRPSNVDDKIRLGKILDLVTGLAEDYPVIFPVHPRTKLKIEEFFPRVLNRSPNFFLVPPMAYLKFIRLLSNAALAITDSGGIQEETTYFGVPCLTMRDNTERPITISLGTNRLVTPDVGKDFVLKVTKGSGIARPSIPLWDGRTSERIINGLMTIAVGNC